MKKFSITMVSLVTMAGFALAQPKADPKAGSGAGSAAAPKAGAGSAAAPKAGAGSRAYVCRGSTCSAPVESLTDLVRTAQARLQADG